MRGTDRAVTKRALAVSRRCWFPVLWSFIGLVSAVDSYLIVRFRDLIPDLEQNPLGQYLIQLQGGDVGVFLRTKAAGTIVVLSVLAGLYVYRHRWAAPIVSCIACFQMGLLLYVTLSLPVHTDSPRQLADLVDETAAAGRLDASRQRLPEVPGD